MYFLEGLIDETPNSIRKSAFYEIAWKELSRCLAELPSLADNTQSSARHGVRLESHLQQKLSSPPPHVSCPTAFVPELGSMMGEVDPSSRLDVLKHFKSVLLAS